MASKKAAQREVKDVVLSVKFGAWLVRALDTVAKMEGTTRAAVIRRSCMEMLKREGRATW